MTDGEFTDITKEVDELLTDPGLASKIAERRAEMQRCGSRSSAVGE